jgi:GNAT superfamily N-acetyltransferase
MNPHQEDVLFRRAELKDLPAIIHMLADDELASQRERDEHPLPQSYLTAFEEINRDPHHELIVAELDGEVIGTLHLMFIPSLSYQGGLRSQVESVRIDRRFQNKGLGSQMMNYAIERAHERDAHIMQLTSHNTRTDAHRFYERLGFKSTHAGMKLKLK